MDGQGADDLVYDPSDPAVMADPFPVYARLRDEDPVHWSPSVKSWIVTRYDDVRDLLLSDHLSVNRLVRFYTARPPEEAALLRDLIHYLNLWLAFRDPPDHTRLRRIMRHAFTAPAIERMRPNIVEITEMLLDRLETRGAARVDLIREFALQLPAFVIMDLLDVPRDRLDDFKAWSDDMAVFIGGARNATDKYTRAARGCRKMSAYFRDLVAERRRDPRPSFLMDLIEAQDDGDSLTDDELVATCILVLFAGHETTTNLIGNAALLLLRHPDQLASLRADPGRIHGAIEEVLRYDGPTNALVREVAEDHVLHGRHLREGDRVFVMVNSANRDPRQFSEPERFDITRTQNRHLTFGQGIHLCLGAKLAREEGRVAVQALFERFPELALDPEEPPEWLDAMVPRGTRRLPVRLKG
ncbi:cytochrome P450 [Rhodosalinus sediminis]|jgi:cytochrome P450|uniref:Cytochrome P450 n=1 Tax=Rhodosalinus sediminis TaxID=1940533 RepID=A0A3D9BNQ8_9RHOB|nr:cytochrome P450 [Rhodosalinus sediminis]REC55140.1 cytochrome P450 [Rhodosalinus sediminis]